jgi:hypothetical protein
MAQFEGEDRAKRVRNYFKTPPRPVREYVKAAIGFIVTVVFAHYVILVLVGLVILAWGVVGLLKYVGRVFKGRPKATDTEMDEWLNSEIPNIIRIGAQQLNVHPTELSDTLDNSALVFVGLPEMDGVRVKRGRDRKLRYSDYDVLVVYLSNWRLPVFQIIYDMEHGARMGENTKEYNLNQVDGVETSNDRVSLNVDTGSAGKKAQLSAAGDKVVHVKGEQQLALIVSGRQAITLTIGVSDVESVKVENVADAVTMDKLSSGPGSQSGGLQSTELMISRLREHLRARHQGTFSPSGGFTGGVPGLNAPGFAPPGLGAPGNLLGLDLPPQGGQPGAFGPAQPPGYGQQPPVSPGYGQPSGYGQPGAPGYGYQPEYRPQLPGGFPPIPTAMPSPEGPGQEPAAPFGDVPPPPSPETGE